MVDERPGRAGQRRARSNAAATRRGEVRRRMAATALNVNAAGRTKRAATRPRRTGTRLADNGTLLLRRRGCAKEQGDGARGLHAGTPACCVLRFATAGNPVARKGTGLRAGRRGVAEPHAGESLAGRAEERRDGEARPWGLAVDRAGRKLGSQRSSAASRRPSVGHGELAVRREKKRRGRLNRLSRASAATGEQHVERRVGERGRR
jgi:hypothetical protein